MKRVIIDTDTAGDDTTAILMALHYFKVEGVTIAGGNVQFDQQVKNALYTIQIANPGYKVPVYKGHASPSMTLMDESHWTEERIMGEDGMGNANFDAPNQQPETKHAVDFMIETIHAHPGEIELLAIAPLTNIAMAIKRDPTIVPKIKHLWIMGGVNNAIGNINAVAEFNFYTDPEAAKIVLHSGIEMTMVTWDMCLKHAVMYEDHIQNIRALNTKGSQFFLDVNLHVRDFEFKKRGVDGITCPDSVVAGIMADESMMEQATKYYVDIETKGELTRGYNLVDLESDLGKPANVRVCEKINEHTFQQQLLDVLGAID
ncbi:nucleoside hydrolase [Dolosicoccus paucivorans]|uniref:Ribosylpyrimidine nucleosidase n=1 Tax=Dolosicoccus paucivorans TaxID=84521 RepID=A0A2N6SNL2_9LACT|nr:nucleoside hydrolase [Dolosicoccus paucivorans]PMB84204.1 ribosylpyrimidine nucleosidase [Dolosicoccus paucivorans]PMC58667.1 ribosylpyrimidine nucleosidase [Dolosicoccus paucivorans]